MWLKIDPESRNKVLYGGLLFGLLRLAGMWVTNKDRLTVDLCLRSGRQPGKQDEG